MRTIPILTATALAIASAGGAYYFLRDKVSAKRAEEARPSISSTSNLDVQDTPIRDGRRNQPANPEQPRITQLNEKVASLEARLRYLETAASEQTKNEAVSRPDKPVSNNGAEEANAKNLSEGDFGHWMDEALDVGYFDRDATTLAIDQVETSLAKVPRINLADMRCSERFCRATLISENNKPVDISQLMGASPFIGSGTTIHEPDGSVKFYFTQPGQSLSELRSEAQEIVLGDIHTE